jgi:hypothetical protein
VPTPTPGPTLGLARVLPCPNMLLLMLSPRPACLSGEVVEELERLLAAVPELVGDVFAIPRARIPVIKFVWKPTGTKVRRRRSGSTAARRAAA